MKERDERKPRARWFQFDLRLLFVLIAAVAVILALELRRGFFATSTNQRRFIETIQVGDRANVDTYDGRDMIIVSDEYTSVISEIGEDFIAIRYDDGRERFVPFDRISRITRWKRATPKDSVKNPIPIDPGKQPPPVTPPK